MSIDLTLGMASFTTDAGRVVQTFLQGAERMSAGARAVARDIAKQSEALAGSTANALALRAAAAGLGDGAFASIEAIRKVGTASAAARSESVALFAGSETAARSYHASLDALTAKSVVEIKQLNAALDAEKAKLSAKYTDPGAQVSPADKASLTSLTQSRDQLLQKLNLEFAEKAALIKQEAVAAATAEASAVKQVAAAQRIIDAQKGRKAGYLEELELLRQLRDAGNLSPAQFKTAATSLAQQQPAAKALAERRAAAAQVVNDQKKVADAVAESAARQVAAAQRVKDALRGLNADYRKNLYALREQRDAGLLSPDQFRAAGARLVTQQPVAQLDQPSISRILAGTQGITKFGQSLKGVADASKLTKYEMLTLNYTVSDVVASLASGINPMTILLQQGGQVRDVFGGVGQAFSKIGSLFTLTRVAVGGVIGVVAGLAYAMYKGAQQSREYADAVVLSGNYAGQTESSFTALTRSVAASGEVTAKAAREFGQALIATGEVGPKVFAAATAAAARYGQATGKNAKEVADDFAAMGRDVTKWATEHNTRLNFVTAAQLQHIRLLQEQGRSVEAQSAVYTLLNQRLADLEPNLGILDKTLRGVTVNWSRFWDAAFDVGRNANPADKLREIRDSLAFASNNPAYTPEQRFERGGAVLPALSDAERKRLNAELRAREQAQASAQLTAASTAELARLNKEAADVAPFIKGMQDRANTTGALTRELEAANLAFAKQDALAAKDSAFKATPQAERTAIFKNIIDQNTRKGGSRAKLDREPEQIRREQLAADLKFLHDKLSEERDTLAFNNREVAALYQSGTVSLKDYYAARTREIADGTQKQLNALTDEQARLEVELTSPLVQANPSERVKIQGQLDEVINKSTQVATAGARAVRLANLDEAQAFQQLSDQVANYRAELAQLQGDDVGAARIRTAQAIKAAQELAKRSEGTPGALTAQERADQIQGLRNANALNQVRRETDLINQGLALSEERIALLQKTGALDEFSALEAQGRARRAVVGQLEAQLAAMEQVRETSKDPQLILNIERTRLELDKLKSSLDPLKEKFDNLFKDSGSNFLNDLIGGKGIRAALASFGNTVASSVNASVSKSLSDKLFGEDGLLGGSGGFLAGLFGGDKGGAAGAQAAATAAITAAQVSSAATIAAANTAAEVASTTAVVTAIGASTTAIVAAIGSSAVASAGSSGIGLLGLGGLIGGGGGFGTGANFGNLDMGLFLDRGGYTGNGGTSEPAGVVHGQEYVFSAPAVKAIGVEKLERLHGSAKSGRMNLPGYEGGGYVGTRPRSVRSAGREVGGTVVNAPITISVAGNVDRRTVDQIAREAGRSVQRAVARGTA